ncbi:hypothetical protein PN36_33700 [Candidatus Thiomargarita nelsonii]|uniref:Uncharacterized protein n=1 Tax=Candidatus Thiomargarita nelsonii TaxID=1003181 RepID=A0A0A6S0F1_9GAMM|nr:hypothetical protein PN36_33700 [Candidatus Thiomargarita nelsonii]
MALTLALGLEFLPYSAKVPLPETYLLISAGLVGCWLLTGWLGDKDEDWVVGVAGGGAIVVKNSLKTGTPSLLARLAFLLLLAAHLFLIWFSFLGGWRLFA